MDQHSIPRQITSFEFKLIGFMTLKQFIYLVIFAPIGFIVYKLFPIPFLNALLGILVALAGVALAFFPVNDRPLDVWVRNFIKRLASPTQYTFKKENPPVYFLNNLFFNTDPHRIMSHIESQKKLASYLSSTKQTSVPNVQKQTVQNLFQSSDEELVSRGQNTPVINAPSATVQKPKPPAQTARLPFFTGVVKNNRQIPLSGVLVYMKDQNNIPVRLLKTNPHGIFATYSPLPIGEYVFEVRDPKGSYFFDTMRIAIQESNAKAFEFISKELL